MAEILFKPFWVSETFSDVTEATRVTVQLETREMATVAADGGATSLYVGAKAAEITRVSDRMGDVPFLVSDGLLVFSRQIDHSGILVLEAETVSHRFSVLTGALPPGLALSPTGLLSGVTANVPALVAKPYQFTIRVTNGTAIKDRRFVINAVPTPSPSFWDFATVPPLSYVPSLQNAYRRFGVLNRGDAFVHAVGIKDEDGKPFPKILLSSVPSVSNPDVINGRLPAGLRLDGENGVIAGSVSVSATPGLYTFLLSIEGSDVDPLLCLIEVSGTLAPIAAPPISIIWNTPAGSIGTIEDGLPSYLAISASSVLGASVTYSLVGTTSLPPGLVLDARTGYLIGRPRVSRTETFVFQVRAAAGTVYEDREFSITVSNRLAPVTLYDVDYRIMADLARNLVEPYRALIPRADLFRLEDPSFGFPDDHLVEIVHNLAASPNEAQLADYHDPAFLLLGPHKVAVARDSTGTIVYEVLYRPFSDPNERAGGFIYRDYAPIEQRIDYPQARSSSRDIDYVFPNSIANIRADLVRDIGFGTSNPQNASKIGLDGNELLPRWMTSRQEDGTVLGYTPALVIAYLKPGTGSRILSLVETSTEVPNRGHVVEFDRYLVSSRTEAETLFSDAPYRVLLVHAPAGTEALVLGKWTALANIITIAENGAYIGPLAYNKDVDAGTIAFGALERDAVLHVVVPDGPISGEPIASGFTDIVAAGPLTSGVTALRVNGALQTYERDDTETNLVVDGLFSTSEVTINIGTTPRFDMAATGRGIRFDLGEVRLGKYKKV